MSKCLDEQGLRRVWGKVKSYLATMLVDFTEEQLEEICDFEEGMNEDDVIPKATKSLLGCVVVGDGLDVDPNGVLSNGYKMDLLWTNASPASAFPSQTLSLDLSEYERVKIFFALSTSGIDELAEEEILIGKRGRAVSTSSTICWQRTAETRTTGVWFEDAFFNGTRVTDYHVPRYIYGIKGVS